LTGAYSATKYTHRWTTGGGYFRDSQFGTYLMLYDSLLKHLAMPRLMIVLTCPFGEIMRRIRARGREDELAAEESHWKALYDVYSSSRSSSAPGRGFPTAGS